MLSVITQCLNVSLFDIGPENEGLICQSEGPLRADGRKPGTSNERDSEREVRVAAHL
jgi:hypothetical protein